MKHTKEEIINALKVIKEECTGTQCRNCPFGEINGVCRLEERTPALWDITDEPPKTWRALK